MARLAGFLLAALALATAGCGRAAQDIAAVTPEPPKFANEWLAFASSSPEDVYAGHYIQRDQPQAVIDAINEVVEKARTRSQ